MFEKGVDHLEVVSFLEMLSLCFEIIFRDFVF